MYGRKKLLYWLSENASIEETYTYIQSAGIFSILGDRMWQALVLTNVTKSKLPFAGAYYENFVTNGNKFYSQLGQDCLVDTFLKHKENGVYVEIGVGNGKELSNTYYFEKYRGWKGVLCEPAKQFHDSIKKQREAVLVENAVYKASGAKLNFVESVNNGELSGLAGFGSVSETEKSEIKSYEVTTVTFNEICEKYISGHVIDYLSIDTEGSEYEILSSIDFTKYSVSCITVEHNYDAEKLRKIRSLLLNSNFIEFAVDVFKWDAVFVNRNISW